VSSSSLTALYLTTPVGCRHRLLALAKTIMSLTPCRPSAVTAPVKREDCILMEGSMMQERASMISCEAPSLAAWDQYCSGMGSGGKVRERG
jgi:hypothetical protein